MSSKDWKLSLLAIAAVSMLAACNKDKKTEPTSPFAGIWVLQDNLKEYSTYRGELVAQNRRNFCRCVADEPDRYGDRQYRMRSVLIQASGEVFLYSPGDSATAPGYRESRYIGSLNSQGHFMAGSIGPDGRIVNNWNSGNGRWDLPPQATVSVSGNVLTVVSADRVMVYERHAKTVIDDYALHVTQCLVEYREVRESRRGSRRVMPKDYDPALDEEIRYENDEYYDDDLDRPLDIPNDEDIERGRQSRRPPPRRGL